MEGGFVRIEPVADEEILEPGGFTPGVLLLGRGLDFLEQDDEFAFAARGAEGEGFPGGFLADDLGGAAARIEAKLREVIDDGGGDFARGEGGFVGFGAGGGDGALGGFEVFELGLVEGGGALSGLFGER